MSRLGCLSDHILLKSTSSLIFFFFGHLIVENSDILIKKPHTVGQDIQSLNTVKEKQQERPEF